MDAGTPTSPYPHLDARLQNLTGDAFHFWGAAQARERALFDILNAYSAGDPVQLESALRSVDALIVAGLGALGFHRDPINNLRLRPLGVLGQKSPLCNLDLDGDELRRVLTVSHRPDGAVETWIHESAHARKRPWGTGYREELGRWAGYEEGLAEMLSKEVSRLCALNSTYQPYRRYRRAYETLGEVLRVTPEELSRQFWRHEAGTVRQAFTDVVDDLYHLERGRHLSLQQRLELLTTADTMFDSTMESKFSRSIERSMTRVWNERLL